MFRKTVPLLVMLIILIFLTGCQKDHGLNPQDPITLTLWHNYGGQMKETMDSMVDEFNETLGRENGIIIYVTSISSSEALHDKLTIAANGDFGAPDLPDISTSNPKTAVLLSKKDLLLDFTEQFTEEELDTYVPRFIEEGMLGTDSLYIFPTAKSTEILFLNKTLFDRFAKDTGATYDDLRTFQGIKNTAALYYDWSDAQTPLIPNDGKSFYHTDSLFNLAQVGCKQMGSEFITGESIDYSSISFKRIWDFYYPSAVKGHFSIYDGYASDLMKTGEIICSTGSTAGILFYNPMVTYPDNTTEDIELMLLPYPTFQDGEKIAIQRGSGMIAIKSSEAKAHAQALFLKWFTRPENNLRFVASTGYLPVTREAYGKVMSREIENEENKNMRSLLRVAITMQGNYDFYIPPLFDGMDKLQKDYEVRMREAAELSRLEYKTLLDNMGPDAAYEKWSESIFNTFISGE